MKERVRALLGEANGVLYSLIVVGVLLAACVLSLRRYGVFACQADGYGSDRYLAYCQSVNYSDYDHGAFWFGLEPTAHEAAADAQVLFLGNSRMQFGLSTPETTNWFASPRVRYYLLGFSYNGNYRFEEPLLQRLKPNASAYVINLDLFFESSESPYARAVMKDPDAKVRHEEKRGWQQLHHPLCGRVKYLCGNAQAFFRSRDTGAWILTGGQFRSKPVSYSRTVDKTRLETYTAAGRDFLRQLPVRPECVIFTMVPTVETDAATATAVAEALGLTFVSPELEDLVTFDESHLDQESAQRWSRAFLEAAGGHIRACLGDSGDRQS